MTRFPSGPQLITAAAFVTAVAVVLNPVLPSLPDVTVPALPRVLTESQLSSPGVPVPGGLVPDGVAATPRDPAVAVAAASPAGQPLPAFAGYTPSAVAIVATPIAVPASAGPAVDVTGLTDPASPGIPSVRPVSQVDAPAFWLFDGGGRTPRSPQRRSSPVAVSLPRPAAATGSPGPATGDPDATQPGAATAPAHRGAPRADADVAQPQRGSSVRSR